MSLPPFRARLRLAWQVLAGRKDAVSVLAALDDDRVVDAVITTAPSRREEALVTHLLTPVKTDRNRRR